MHEAAPHWPLEENVLGLGHGRDVGDARVGGQGPVDVALLGPGGGQAGGSGQHSLAQAPVALLVVGLAVVAAGRRGNVGDAGDERHQVDQGRDRPLRHAVARASGLGAHRRHLHGRPSGGDDRPGRRREVGAPAADGPGAKGHDDRRLLGRRQGEPQDGLGGRRRDALHAEARAYGVEHLAARVPHHGLARRVVHGPVGAGEQRGQGLGEHPALVPGVQRLAHRLLHRRHQVVVDVPGVRGDEEGGASSDFLCHLHS